MGTFLWLMLLFPGVCGLSSSVPRQFHVVKEEKTWTEAQQYCREKYTDLTTIDDMAEMEILKGIIQEEGVTQAWIGLKHGSSYKYMWSLADRDFYGENEAEFRNWNPGEPGGIRGDCMFLLEGRWYDFLCETSYLSICYDGVGVFSIDLHCLKVPTLPTEIGKLQLPFPNAVANCCVLSSVIFYLYGYKYMWSLADRDFYGENEAEWYDFLCETSYLSICYDGRNSTHPYVLIEDEMSWRDAQRYCREHYTDLASVRNQAENDLIEAVTPPGDPRAWIGLFKDAWQWSDGSNSSFRNWASGHPGGEDLCAEVLSTGLWRGGGCSERKHFICYGASKEKVKQIVRVQLPVASGVNMEDPDVQEAFLQQMKQRLGLPPDAKVSWRKQADGKVFHKEKKEVKKNQMRNEL